MIINYLSLKDVYRISSVCTLWKTYIDSNKLLWRNLDYSKKSSYEPFNHFENLGTRLEDRLLSKKFSELGNSACIQSNSKCNHRCSILFDQGRLYSNKKIPARSHPISEKLILRGILNSREQLLSISIPDSRNVTKKLFSEILSRSRPRLQKLSLSCLKPPLIPPVLSPLVSSLAQTNHLTNLCISYNPILTSKMVIEIAKNCTQISSLDLSCCSNVDWLSIISQFNLNPPDSFFPNLENLFINDQLESFILICTPESRLVNSFNKLSTLSISWNSMRRKLFFPGSYIPLSKAVPNSYRNYKINFSLFPNLKHICLDGHFDVYTPVFIDLQNGENNELVIPEWCVFSCGFSSKLDNRAFISLISASQNLKALDISWANKLDSESVYHLLSLEKSQLNSLNISGCLGFSVEDLIRMSKKFNDLSYIDFSYTNCDTVVASEMVSMVTRNLETLILDGTSVSDSGVAKLIAKIVEISPKCYDCNSLVSPSMSVCKCRVAQLSNKRGNNGLRAVPQTEADFVE
ncbi:hypothetical protein AYI69_g2536 [Smittium culicis]|uniref:F-box domain-containing protein n=1 Tax=Smittium culicis TaxID=133412 RepID=A0A1R1YM75_9FUNG|nr:hypothetical protein AYI69_g2536 [Smittium culicis]